MGITEKFLKERVRQMDAILHHYSRKSLIDGLPENTTIRYSRLPQEVLGLTVTNYILFPGLTLPALEMEMPQHDHAEYWFSDEGWLMRKILHKEHCRQECFYVYENERHIRLTYQDNSLRELHCVCYDGGVLTEVFTACFSDGVLSHLSGEVYECRNTRIVSSEHYRDYIPALPALICREIQGLKIILNPIVSGYDFDYDANIVRTAHPKEFANGKELPALLTEYAEGKNIDRYLLW